MEKVVCDEEQRWEERVDVEKMPEQQRLHVEGDKEESLAINAIRIGF